MNRSAALPTTYKQIIPNISTGLDRHYIYTEEESMIGNPLNKRLR